MRSAIEPWQRRRGELNHDWLKNRLMPALAKLENVLDGRVEDGEFETYFAGVVLPEWSPAYQTAQRLFDDFPEQMSPRVLIGRKPFDRLPANDREWLGEVVDSLWRDRVSVERLVADAKHSLEVANQAHRKLQERLASNPSALRQARDELRAFSAACRDLARAIEKFPSDVSVA